VVEPATFFSIVSPGDSCDDEVTDAQATLQGLVENIDFFTAFNNWLKSQIILVCPEDGDIEAVIASFDS